VILTLAGAVRAQAPAPEVPKEPEAPKTFLQELAFFGYLENSYVFNLTGVVDSPNELRVYDAKSGPGSHGASREQSGFPTGLDGLFTGSASGLTPS
jgi:hypothetical protein